LKESISIERADLLLDIEIIKGVIGTSLQRLVASEPKISGGVIIAIDEALRNRKKLKITYHSVADDVTTERLVHPIEKKVENGVELLLAFCESADAVRSFRLDRIQKSELVKVASSQTSRVQSGAIESVTVKVHSDVRRVLETLGTLTPGGGDSYSVDIYNQSWLIREVLAAGGAIEVVEPASLRAEIARQAGLVAAQYR
jgi:proteasome accessory factor C